MQRHLINDCDRSNALLLFFASNVASNVFASLNLMFDQMSLRQMSNVFAFKVFAFLNLMLDQMSLRQMSLR